MEIKSMKNGKWAVYIWLGNRKSMLVFDSKEKAEGFVKFIG